MDRPVGTALRWTRAAFLAVVAMLTGTAAHVSAGGYLAGPVAMASLFAICLGTSAWLLGRPASRLRIVLMLMTGQTFFHGALTALGGHAGDAPLTDPVSANRVLPVAATMPEGRRVGSVSHQLYAGRAGDAGDQLGLPAPLHHLLADLTGPHALMAIAHLCAAAAIGLWIARGERALWVLLATGAGVTEVARATTARVSLLACGSVWATVGMLLVQDPLLHRRHRATGWLLRSLARFYLLADLVVRRGPPALLAA